IRLVLYGAFMAIIVIFVIQRNKSVDMETLVKPTYKKPGRDDFFKKLKKEVQEKVLGDKRIQRRNVIKTYLLLFLYVGFYSCILIFGNYTPLLFLFYILLGFSMIMLFINAFHDAAHGAVFKKRKHNQRFMYVLEFFGSNS